MQLEHHHAAIMACILHRDIQAYVLVHKQCIPQPMMSLHKTLTLSSQNVSTQQFIEPLKRVKITIFTLTSNLSKVLPFNHTNKLYKPIRILTSHMSPHNRTINSHYKLILQHIHIHSQHPLIRSLNRTIIMIGERILDKSLFKISSSDK